MCVCVCVCVCVYVCVVVVATGAYHMGILHYYNQEDKSACVR